MLGKLIKQDLLRDYLKILCIFPLVIIASIALRKYRDFLYPIEGYKDVIMSLSFVPLLVVAVLTMSFSIESFKKTMIKDEGYLTHTLPVKTSSLLLSKMITSYIWSFFTVIIFVINQTIINGTDWLSDFNIASIFEGFKAYGTDSSPNEIFGTMAFLMILFAPFMFYSLVFFCFAFENLFNKYKEVALFFLIIACITISVIYMYFAYSMIVNFEISPKVTDVDYAINKIDRMFYGYFVWIPLLASVGLYIASNMIFTKKLNLQ